VDIRHISSSPELSLQARASTAAVLSVSGMNVRCTCKQAWINELLLSTVIHVEGARLCKQLHMVPVDHTECSAAGCIPCLNTCMFLWCVKLDHRLCL